MPSNKKKGRRKNTQNSTSSSTSGRNAAGPVGKDGRMPEQDGRRFYRLLSILGTIAVPKLNEERQAINMAPITWYIDMARNALEARETVMIYILQQIDWLVEQLDEECHDQLIRQLMGGRRLTADDKAQIESWKLHVEDDFIVVEHKDFEGMIFVQVGDLRKKEEMEDSFRCLVEKDIHEPRCFVVQGLADPLLNLLARPAAEFQKRHVSIREAYPDLKSLTMIHTALLPYMGGITYMTILSPVRHLHYRTPKDVHLATKLAVKSVRALYAESGDNNAATSGTTNAKLYRKLDPARDGAICRLANEPVNQGMPAAFKDVDHEHEQRREEADTTPILLNQVFWQAHADRNSAVYKEMQERATGGPDSLPFLLEGVKNTMAREILVKDGDPCPFHKRYGEEDNVASFDSCCKRQLLQRKAKAKENALHGMRMHIMWNPLDRAEMDKLDALTDYPTIDLLEHMRIAYQDTGAVRLKVPPPFVSVIKERMDYCPYFHATMEYKWVYWGFVPVKMAYTGSVMSFGDVLLDEKTGVFEAEAMTSGRLNNLIVELKRICTGIPILEASMEMQPAPKVKPDPKAMEENRALLQEGLDVEVKFTIDKEKNEGMTIHCGYCGASEKDGVKLLRCSCKSTFYCDKKHQKAHWKDHKEKCIRIRQGA